MENDHAHEHDHHDHDHDHGHAHGVPGTGRAFMLGIALNFAFVVIGVIYGIAAHSVALVADAAHNMGDVLGLFLAWGATRLAEKKPSARHTYGLRRSTILAALANAILLLVALGGVAWEALIRLRSPSPVEGKIVIVVATIGIFVNGISALLFMKGREKDVNIRGAFLHLMSDAAVSLGVVIAAFVMIFTHWMWLDPVVSLLVTLVVLASTYRLLKESANLALDAVPGHIDPEKVRAYLAGLTGVQEVHDLHIWAMSTTEVALTAHLVMVWSECPPTFLGELGKKMRETFAIGHVTVQIEPSDAPECKLAPESSV